MVKSVFKSTNISHLLHLQITASCCDISSIKSQAEYCNCKQIASNKVVFVNTYKNCVWHFALHDDQVKFIVSLVLLQITWKKCGTSLSRSSHCVWMITSNNLLNWLVIGGDLTEYDWCVVAKWCEETDTTGVFESIFYYDFLSRHPPPFTSPANTMLRQACA